jgi:hypothetical protein
VKDIRVDARRGRLAAKAAADLILDYSSTTLRTTKGSDYIELANLLHDTATGKNTSNLRAACRAHLAELSDPKKRYLTQAKQKGGKKKPRPLNKDSELDKLMHVDAVKEQIRRETAARRWRPLQQIVDEILVS